jgi:hypothetical protein
MSKSKNFGVDLGRKPTELAKGTAKTITELNDIGNINADNPPAGSMLIFDGENWVAQHPVYTGNTYSDYFPGFRFVYVNQDTWKIENADLTSFIRPGQRIKFLETGESSPQFFFGIIDTVTFVGGDTQVEMLMEYGGVLNDDIYDWGITAGDTVWQPIGNQDNNTITAPTWMKAGRWIGVPAWFVYEASKNVVHISTNKGVNWIEYDLPANTKVGEVAYSAEEQKIVVICDDESLRFTSNGSQWTTLQDFYIPEVEGAYSGTPYWQLNYRWWDEGDIGYVDNFAPRSKTALSFRSIMPLPHTGGFQIVADHPYSGDEGNMGTWHMNFWIKDTDDAIFYTGAWSANYGQGGTIGSDDVISTFTQAENYNNYGHVIKDGVLSQAAGSDDIDLYEARFILTGTANYSKYVLNFNAIGELSSVWREVASFADNTLVMMTNNNDIWIAPTGSYYHGQLYITDMQDAIDQGKIERRSNVLVYPCNCMAYSTYHDIIIVAGIHGTMHYSADGGATWPAIQSGFGFTQNIIDIAWSEDDAMWMAIDQNGRIHSSLNGVTD